MQSISIKSSAEVDTYATIDLTGSPSVEGQHSSTAPGAEMDSTAGAAGQPASRKRRRTQVYRMKSALDSGMTPAEIKMMQVAMERSKLDKVRVSDAEVPEAPCFTPTLEEWQDPMQYIRSISKAGYEHGIVRIIPPEAWDPPCGLTPSVIARRFSTRRQAVHSLQQGLPFPDGQDYSLLEYRAMANKFKASHFPQLLPKPASPNATRMPPCATRPISISPVANVAADVEREYWDIVETGKTELTVEYGNDQDTRVYGSGFPMPEKRGEFSEGHAVDLASKEYYRNSGWNVNNMPYLKGSPIRHMQEETPGINVPWLYAGMLFATFAWHLEDQYFYSVNYMFHGEAKQWYGIAPADYKLFQETLRKFVHERMEELPDLLHHMTTVIPPSILQAAGIRVVKLLQEPGQFVITFPQAYHGGFSHGFNVAEACNFALPDWLPFGRRSVQDYSISKGARPVCVSLEELVIKMAVNCSEYEPATCRRVAEELRRIIDDERKERQAFAQTTSGHGRAVELKGNEPRYDCVVTKKMCYLSAVVCYSKACRLEAQKQRQECNERRLTRRKELQALGIPLAPVDEEEQQRVAKPKHMQELCNCNSESKIMVFWHRLDFLEELCAKVLQYASRKCTRERPFLRLDSPLRVKLVWTESTDDADAETQPVAATIVVKAPLDASEAASCSSEDWTDGSASADSPSDTLSTRAVQVSMWLPVRTQGAEETEDGSQPPSKGGALPGATGARACSGAGDVVG